MKKIIKLTEKDIQKLVTKIIRENVDDEFSWVKDLDVNMGERQYKKKWGNIESDWGVDMDDTFELLVDNGITKLNVLNDIAEELHIQFNKAWDEGREYGADNDTTCDGCCDDYIYYDDHRDQVREARDEAYEEGRNSGFDDGYEEGKDSRDDEVSELEEKIYKLEERITDLESELEDSNSEDRS